MAPARRTVLRLGALAAALLLPGGAALAQRMRPPENHVRLAPILIPLPRGGSGAYVRIEADLVLQTPAQRDFARTRLPRIIGDVVGESWDLPLGEDGRITAEGAKAIKERILRSARNALGDQVQDVLLVSLLESR